MKLIWVLTAFLIIALIGIYTIRPSQQYNPSDVIFDQVNSLRISIGVSPLTKTDGICQIASERLQQVLAGDYSHQPFEHDTKKWYSYYDGQAMGENIANNTLQGIYGNWFYSPHHYQNMTDPKWKNGCVSFGSNYAVMIFGQPK